MSEGKGWKQKTKSTHPSVLPAICQQTEGLRHRYGILLCSSLLPYVSKGKRIPCTPSILYFHYHSTVCKPYSFENTEGDMVLESSSHFMREACHRGEAHLYDSSWRVHILLIQPLILEGFIIKSDMLLPTDRIHMEGKEWQQKSLGYKNDPQVPVHN